MRMEHVFALLGIPIIAFAILYYFNRDFTPSPDTSSEGATSAPMRTTSTLKLTSSAFEHEGSIPSKYTCDGDRTVSPPLSISGVPAEAKSLVLLMDDPDVPKVKKSDGMFDHWTLYNIPSPPVGGTIEIPENGPVPGDVGANTSGQLAYTGPCPPKEYEPSEHRYFFKLYALDTELALPTGATKAEVEQAMEGHIIDQTQLMGRYKRK